MESSPALVIFIKEVRRSLRALFISVVGATAVVFFLSPQLLELIQAHLSKKLYFFSVAGPFLGHVKLALFAALFGLMPWIIVIMLRIMQIP